MPAGPWAAVGKGSCLGTTPWQAARAHSLSGWKPKHPSRRPQTQLARREAPDLTQAPSPLYQRVLGPGDRAEPEARCRA